MQGNEGKGINIKNRRSNYKRTSPGALSGISDHKSVRGVSNKLRNGVSHKRVQQRKKVVGKLNVL